MALLDIFSKNAISKPLYIKLDFYSRTEIFMDATSKKKQTISIYNRDLC